MGSSAESEEFQAAPNYVGEICIAAGWKELAYFMLTRQRPESSQLTEKVIYFWQQHLLSHYTNIIPRIHIEAVTCATARLTRIADFFDVRLSCRREFSETKNLEARSMPTVSFSDFLEPGAFFARERAFQFFSESSQVKEYPPPSQIKFTSRAKIAKH
jgi:hypothetical protein